MAIAYAHSDAGSGTAAVPSAASIAAGVQSEDMNAGLLVQVVLGVAAIVTVLVIVVFQIMNLSVQTVEMQLAEGVGQSARAEVELAAAGKLTQYAVVDAGAGIYQIPIERAMELIAGETYEQPADGFTDEVRLLPGE